MSNLKVNFGMKIKLQVEYKCIVVFLLSFKFSEKIHKDMYVF